MQKTLLFLLTLCAAFAFPGFASAQDFHGGDIWLLPRATITAERYVHFDNKDEQARTFLAEIHELGFQDEATALKFLRSLAGENLSFKVNIEKQLVVVSLTPKEATFTTMNVSAWNAEFKRRLDLQRSQEGSFKDKR